MPEARKRMGAGAYRDQWRRAKEDIQFLERLGLEVLSLTAKANTRLDSLYEGVIGEEAPDLTEQAS